MPREADVGRREAKRGGDLFARLGVGDLGRQFRQSEFRLPRLAGAMAREAGDLADRLLQHDANVLAAHQARGAQFADKHGGADRWMSGEWQFRPRRKNA